MIHALHGNAGLPADIVPQLAANGHLFHPWQL